MKFAYSGDGVRINIPGELSQLTLVASISLDRSNNDYSGIME